MGGGGGGSAAAHDTHKWHLLNIFAGEKQTAHNFIAMTSSHIWRYMRICNHYVMIRVEG